jgi:hypothetical protein
MLSRTTATASLSVSALSSTNPSRFLCHLSPNASTFLGLKKLSSTSPNPLSDFVSIRWNTNKSNTTNKCERSRMASFTTRASAQPLKNPEELIESVKTFIFDCDGEGGVLLFFILEFFYFFPVQVILTKKRKNMFNTVELDLFVHQSISMCVGTRGRLFLGFFTIFLCFFVR